MLSNVSHQYRGERDDSSFTLGPLDLTLARGEVLFIVGGNGSGKSTLARVLTGLYPPETGEIRIDDQRVTDESREWYRQHFAAVFADYFLFDDLAPLGVATRGDGEHLDAAARNHLVDLHLDHRVTIEAGVLSTTTELSQGQRKRLALLTAFLQDRPVDVFDEWASDQDPQFKDVFYTKILRDLRSRGKAVVVITHDDRYFHVGDRIVRLDAGRIIASNTA
jgi:putative ATP-binding cassette transporter